MSLWKNPTLQFILILQLCLLTCVSYAKEVCVNPDFTGDTKPWGISQTDDMPVKQMPISDLEGVQYAMYADVQKPQPKSSWRCGLNQTIPQFIPKDSPIKLTFKAKGSAEKKLSINLQTNGHPWDSTLHSGDIILTDEWKTYTYEGKAKRDYVPGGLRLYVTFGQNQGNASITDVHLNIEGAGLPPFGQAINTNPNFKHRTSGWWYNTKHNQGKVLDEDGKPYVQLILDDVDPSKYWEHSFNQRLVSPFPKGTKILITAILRSPTDDAKVDFYLQGKSGNKERIIFAPGIRLTNQWQTYEFSATMPKDYKARDCEMSLHMGYQPQIIEIQQILMTTVDAYEPWIN
tara:strand:+ start:3203 stop:4237 length:1035 start_codon:yes stop_codon:yes gene_type:complete